MSPRKTKWPAQHMQGAHLWCWYPMGELALGTGTPTESCHPQVTAAGQHQLFWPWLHSPSPLLLTMSSTHPCISSSPLSFEDPIEAPCLLLAWPPLPFAHFSCHSPLLLSTVLSPYFSLHPVFLSSFCLQPSILSVCALASSAHLTFSFPLLL